MEPIKGQPNNEPEEIENNTTDTSETTPKSSDIKPDITREDFRNTALSDIAAAAEELSFDDTDDFDCDDFDVYDNNNIEYTASAPAHEDEELSKKSKKKKKKKNLRKFIRKHRRFFESLKIAVVVIIVAAVGIYTYGCMTVPTNVMGRNVYIESVKVSNMTYDEALTAVQDANLLGNRNITLICEGQTYSISGDEVALSARREDTVQKALSYGKTGNVLYDGLLNSIQIFVRHTVVPNADVNEEVLRNHLTQFGNQVYGELVEHKLEIGEEQVIGTPGHTGFNNNTDTAYDEVKAALENERFNNISVTLKAGPPRTLSLDDLDAFTYKDPVDAYFDYSDGGVGIIAEEFGRYLDRDEAAPIIEQLREGGEIIYVPYYVSYPEISAEQLQEKLFNDTIGSYSTNYGTSNANRCANIANASDKINGKVLKPGEVFSFNDTVGPRSVANGFYTAKEYMDGKTVDGIGGGTCQVSSTLYNAVLYSDLSIVSRTNHMFPVGYCPIGQDATVSDTGVDFKFVNSMEYPIQIVSETSGYTITVSIVGTQRDDPRTVKITNTATAVGNDQSVHSVRKVYNSAGELIQSDDLGNSYYMAHPE